MLFCSSVTADGFEISGGAAADFGIDGYVGGPVEGEKRWVAYQKAIKEGTVTKAQLFHALGNGPELSKLIGETVWTVYDILEGRK
jgi:hypothetical protein